LNAQESLAAHLTPTLLSLPEYVLSAKGAVFIPAWGNALGIRSISTAALKARFIPKPESRLQCFMRIRSQVLGRYPQAFNEKAPLALKTYLLLERIEVRGAYRI
jgi:hypothetical protein